MLGAMELLAMTFAAGWAAGLNPYATVFILGLLGRFLGADAVPVGFERTDVLIVMGVLALVEFVADKVPVIDSLWDVPSTIIRPVAGGAIGALAAGAQGDLLTIALASVGGLTALLSHLSKAGIRLAINTSPEPVTNLGASIVGDLTLIVVVTLAVLYPVPAAIVAGIALLAMLLLALTLAARIRKGFGWLRARWRAAAEGPDQKDFPEG